MDVSRRKCKRKQSRKLLLELPVSAVTLFLHFTTSSKMVCAKTYVNNSLMMIVQCSCELVDYVIGPQDCAYIHIYCSAQA